MDCEKCEVLKQKTHPSPPFPSRPGSSALSSVSWDEGAIIAFTPPPPNVPFSLGWQGICQAISRAGGGRLGTWTRRWVPTPWSCYIFFCQWGPAEAVVTSVFSEDLQPQSPRLPLWFGCEGLPRPL